MTIDPVTRQKIREHIAEHDPLDVYYYRKDYLKTLMQPQVENALYAIAGVECGVERMDTMLVLLYKDRLDTTLKKIKRMIDELHFTKPTDKPSRITEEMIDNAHNYPFTDLHEFRNSMALCPFHSDRDPSMRYYSDNNTVYCFSCGKSWDTIGFVMEKEGIGFVEAVEGLQ